MIDNLITKKIKNILKNRIHTLTAVCFVVKSSDSKISSTQKYILAKVLELFGKDIAENLIAMITFCDGEEPPVLEALTSNDCTFGQLKNLSSHGILNLIILEFSAKKQIKCFGNLE